jgi:hypothetical protein
MQLNRANGILKIVAFCAILGILPVISTATPVAHAYGNTAMWQIGFAFTCNKVSNPLCGGAKAGNWGWVELDSGGLGEVQGTFYFPPYSGSGVGSGLVHLAISIMSWNVNATAGVFALLSGSAVASGGAVRTAVSIPNVCAIGFCGNLPFPASPGHYNAQTLFGQSAGPGAEFQIQVVKLTH